jgi:hypothetical protein
MTTDVVAALADLRDVLAWPADDDGADLTARAVARLQPRRRRRWPFVAVGAVVVVGVGVPVAASRLSVGGVRISYADELPAAVGTALELGVPTEVRPDAQRPAALGGPIAAFEGQPAGGYTELWPGPVIVTSFPGSVGTDQIEKQLVDGTTASLVVVEGADAALWIDASHGFLYVDDNGHVLQDTIRLSGHALIWTVGDTTYRLESPDLDRATAIVLAESML